MTAKKHGGPCQPGFWKPREGAARGGSRPSPEWPARPRASRPPRPTRPRGAWPHTAPPRQRPRDLSVREEGGRWPLGVVKEPSFRPRSLGFASCDAACGRARSALAAGLVLSGRAARRDGQRGRGPGGGLGGAGQGGGAWAASASPRLCPGRAPRCCGPPRAGRGLPASGLVRSGCREEGRSRTGAPWGPRGPR